MNDYIKITLAVIVLYVLYKVWSFFQGGINAASAVGTALSNNIEGDAVKKVLNSYGVNNTNATKLVNDADKIYNALYKNDWFGWSEDEDTAIAIFNSYSLIEEVKALAAVYLTNYSHSLYNDLNTYVSTDKLKTFTFNSIKTL